MRQKRHGPNFFYVFLKNIEKVWHIENFCSIRKGENKRIPTFFYVKFLYGHAYNINHPSPQRAPIQQFTQTRDGVVWPHQSTSLRTCPNCFGHIQKQLFTSEFYNFSFVDVSFGVSFCIHFGVSFGISFDISFECYFWSCFNWIKIYDRSSFNLVFT